MRKHELREENRRLKQERNELSQQIAEQESDLMGLGLIPDEYIIAIASGSRYIKWNKIREDRKDLATHEAAERGRKLAGVDETTIEVTIDTDRLRGLEDFDRFLKSARQAQQKPRKPWLGAKDGEIWEIFVPGDAILCRTDDDGDFHPVFGHHHYATIANGSKRIGNARRIWPEEPETGDSK